MSVEVEKQKPEFEISEEDEELDRILEDVEKSLARFEAAS